MLTLKGGKDFNAAVGSPIGIGIDPARVYVFDGASGLRLR